MIYIIDTSALFAFFWQETGGDKVKATIEAANDRKATLHLSRINLGEMYYMAWKKRNQQVAENMLADTLLLPIFLESATNKRIMEAARFKAQHALSYADAFAAALAVELGGTVITRDPEFKNVEKLVKIEWL